MISGHVAQEDFAQGKARPGVRHLRRTPVGTRHTPPGELPDSLCAGAPVLEITGRSRELRSPRGSSWPLIIHAIAHRFAPLFEVGDLSTEKGDTDIGGLNFRGSRRATFLRACVFGRIIDAVHFFIISATYDAPVIVKMIGMRTFATVPGLNRQRLKALTVELSRIGLPMLCSIVASVTAPLPVSTVSTHTPLPVIFRLRASYG